MNPGKKVSRLLISAIVLVMVVSLTSAVLISAGAINENVSVKSHSVVNNSPPITSIAAGQVWTGKNVSESGSFGDGPNGQFTVTLSAVGGSTGSALIDSAGLTFNDTFEDEYAFVAPESQLTFYLDGVTHTVGLAGGVYQYTEGLGNTLVEVTLNPTDNTVKYFIGANALKTIEAGAVSDTSVFNSLVFGVRLLDSVATAGTYNTNQPSSCTALFNTLQTNSEFVSGVNTNTYQNTEDIYKWDLITPTANASQFTSDTPPKWLIQNLKLTRVYTSFPNPGPDLDNPIPDTSVYYQFSMADGELGFDPATAGGDSDNEWNWDIWIKDGIYHKNGDVLKVDGDMHIFVKTVRTSKPWIVTCSKLPDQFYKGTLITPAVTQFVINGTAPTAAGDPVSVTVGGVTYDGNIGAVGTSPIWSFNSGSSEITLVNADTLTVTTTTSQLLNTTTTVPVTHPHDDYGTVTLEADQDVAGEVDTGVKGDSDVLPQTGGVSISALLGIGGLVLIAGGGTSFMIYRKKFLN